MSAHATASAASYRGRVLVEGPGACSPVKFFKKISNGANLGSGCFEHIIFLSNL